MLSSILPCKGRRKYEITFHKPESQEQRRDVLLELMMVNTRVQSKTAYILRFQDYT